MIETIAKYLHEVFPNQTLFFGLICVICICVLFIIKFLIDGKNTRKFLDLALAYFENKKLAQKKQNEILGKGFKNKMTQ